jgi:hypothetical protein
VLLEEEEEEEEDEDDDPSLFNVETSTCPEGVNI